MNTAHFVVLGLAQARSVWFRDLGRWATSAAIPCDFIKCVSANELRARLESGRPFSALVIDASLSSLDRDLVDAARAIACPVIAVHDGRGTPKDWGTLGISAVLSEPVGRDEFVSTLNEIARPLDHFDAGVLNDKDTDSDVGWFSPLVVVTGPGGSGTSTTAMALAEGLSADTRHAGNVLLADMSLNADQAVLHDVGDVVPGLQEMVEAFRSGNPTSDDIRALTRRPDGRGYDLLTGLRRHRDWVAVRPRAFMATLKALRHTFTMVVADIDDDFEGVDDCGSADVEDRNLMARTTVVSADVVVVTGTATTLGLHRQIRVINDLLRHHVNAQRILPVLLHAPKRMPHRLQYTKALAELTSALPGGPLGASPVFIPTRRQSDRDIRDARPPAAGTVGTVTAAVEAVLNRVGQIAGSPEAEPVSIAPGSLGSWSPQELAG